MTDEMEELLAELKAEYDSQPTQDKSQSAPPPKRQSPSDDVDSEELFDDLLADVKSEVETQAKSNTTKHSTKTSSQASSSAKTPTTEPNQFYEELRQQQQARERQVALQRQQQQAEERQVALQRQQEAKIAAKKRAEHRELRRKTALKDKARQWLQNLDSNSEEGKWFEEFSYSYDSRLDAAVDYLQAMRESGL